MIDTESKLKGSVGSLIIFILTTHSRDVIKVENVDLGTNFPYYLLIFSSALFAYLYTLCGLLNVSGTVGI